MRHLIITSFYVDVEPGLVTLVYEVPADDKNGISLMMQVLTQSEKLLIQTW